MIVSMLAVAAVILIVLLIVLTRWLKPEATRPVRIFAFVTMVALPAVWLLATLIYADAQMKKVSFCASCHEMGPYVESLTADDDWALSAMHYRDNRVNRKKACYECHTNPGLLGYVDAKLRGLHDIRVHTMGTAPAELSLVSPYPNAICLKCHGEAQNFLEGEGHQYPEDLIAQLKSEEMSCLDCHDVGHYLED